MLLTDRSPISPFIAFIQLWIIFDRHYTQLLMNWLRLSATNVFSCGMFSVRTFVYILLQVPLFASKGLVKFRNIQFESTANQFLTGQCCHENCTKLCDITFEICLKDYSLQNNVCIIKSVSKKIVDENTRNMDVEFGTTYKWPMLLTLKGIQQTSPSNREGQVFSKDGDKQLTFLDTTWNTLIYNSSKVNLQLEYKLSCSPNFHGEKCQRYCQARDDVLGHYTCGKYGNYICLQGWKGRYCNERTCLGTCSHGACIRTTCNCNQGWSGTLCNNDLKLCFTDPCKNNGTCTANGKCKCKKGFTGNKCETKEKQISSSFAMQSSIQTRLSSSNAPTSQLFTAPQMPSTQSAVRTTRHVSSYSTRASMVVSPSRSSRKNSFKTESVIPSLAKNMRSSKPSFKSLSSSVDSSILNVNISKLIESTSWITLNKTSVFTKPPPTTDKTLTLSMAISFTLVTVLLSLTAFVFLWKRSKYRRRRSRTLVTPTQEEGYTRKIYSVASSNSVSSARSISPLLKAFYDTDSGAGSDLPVDMISVIDYRVPEEKKLTFDPEKYTLQAVDKICQQAMKGDSQARIRKNGLQVKNNEGVTNEVNSKAQSEYSSSGYCSSSASPKVNKNIVSQGLTAETIEKLILTCNSAVTNNNTIISAPKTTQAGLNNLQNSRISSASSRTSNGSSGKHSEEGIGMVSRESSDSELSHRKKVSAKVIFEGLPNFICYQEEEETI